VNQCGEAEHEQPQPQLAKCQRRPPNCRAIHSATLKAGAGARQARTAATERSGEATTANQRSNYRPRGRNSQISASLLARSWPPSVDGLRSATKTRAAQRAQRAGASAINKENQQARSGAAEQPDKCQLAGAQLAAVHARVLRHENTRGPARAARGSFQFPETRLRALTRALARPDMKDIYFHSGQKKIPGFKEIRGQVKPSLTEIYILNLNSNSIGSIPKSVGQQ